MRHLRLGVFKGNLHPVAVHGFHQRPAGLQRAGSGRRYDLNFRHLHRLAQLQRDYDILTLWSREAQNRPIVLEQVGQTAAFYLGIASVRFIRVRIRHNRVSRNPWLWIIRIGNDRRYQYRGLNFAGTALCFDQTVDVSQIDNINRIVAVEVILGYIPAVGRTQRFGKRLPVPDVYPAIAVDVAQGAGRVACAHNQMPGVLRHVQLLAVGGVACAGEAKRVLSAGQLPQLQVQISRPASAAQVSAVRVPGGDNRLISAYAVGSGPGQVHPSQIFPVLHNGYLEAAFLQLLQFLGIINPHRCGQCPSHLRLRCPRRTRRQQ